MKESGKERELEIVRQIYPNKNIVQKHRPEEACSITWDLVKKTKAKYDQEGNVIKIPTTISNRSNLAIIFENDPIFESLGYNPHSDQILWQDEQIKDYHLETIGIMLERNYRVRYTDKNIKSAIMRVAAQNEINPIKDYLTSLEWDGVHRIHDILDRVYHADYEKTLYGGLIQEISKNFFISCIARIMDPGCEVHTCLTLVGEKGIGKGLSIKALAGEENYSNSIIDMGNKSAYEMIHQSGVWIWEIAEMSSLQGKTAETAKAFFTGAWDRYRAAYAHFPINRPRRTVFVLSTNNYQILSDGPERRYWPIKIKNGSVIDVEYLRNNRDQLWAEAMNKYQNGSTWYLNRDESIDLQKYQEIFIIDDPWAGTVKKSIDEGSEKSKNPFEATTAEIMDCLDLPIAQRHSGNSRRIAQICRDMGYEQHMKGNRRYWRQKK